MYRPRMVSKEPCGMTSCNSAVLIIITNALVIPSLVRPENVALNKPAFQSGTIGSYTADRAVDGTYRSTSVAIPDARQVNYTDNAVWWVDLVDTYRVTSIKIHGPDQHGKPRTVRYFILSVGPDLTQLSDCSGEYEKPPLPVTIPCNKTGQIVHFRRTGRGYLPYETALREVEVTGITQIKCDLCLSSCNGDTGCEQCPAGKQQPDCVQDCTEGRYGVNCANECGRCADVSGCHITNGICPGVCQTWWTTDKCDKEIVIPNRTDETVAVTDTTHSSLTITWQQVQSLDSELYEYYGYSVFYQSDTDSGYSEATSADHSGTGDITTTVSGLQYNQQYVTKVVPYRTHMNNRTEGAPYPTVQIRTECGHPDPPNIINVTVVDPHNKEVHVIWENIATSGIESRCENISGLRVDSRMSGDPDWINDDVTLSSTAHNISVPEDGVYHVRMVSINNQNFEGISDIHVIEIGTPNTPTESNLVVVAVVVVVVLVLVVAAIVIPVCVIRKRKQKGQQEKRQPAMKESELCPSDVNVDNIAEAPKSRKPSTSTKPMNTTSQDEPSHNVRPGPSETATYENCVVGTAHGKPGIKTNVDKTTDVEQTVSDLNVGPVAVGELGNYTSKKKTKMEFDCEYKSLPGYDLDRCRIGQTDENKLKNRFKNIFAYDDTRIILDTESGTYESDYINANYITGFVKEKEYIATQGPRSDTVVDLWRLIWQEGATRVVMVANHSEGGKRRCAEYWPDGNPGSSNCYGNFSITLESETTCADYTHRTLIVKYRNSSRTIHHFHFTSWEDKNNPVYGAVTLFAFHRMVHSVDSISRGPMVVHCSAGVGRTGTYIAFDILVNQGKAEGRVDVYKWAQKLRRERMTMIQTLGQYVFLHEALAEYFQCGTTAYNLNDLPVDTEIQRQFKVLISLAAAAQTPSPEGLNPENIHKNRDVDVIPSDSHRPYLNTVYEGGTSYINAVLVPSFTNHTQYIVTQMPLPDTIVDFWRLVHEQNCNTIVMLNDMDPDDQSCKQYWPRKDHTKQGYGPIEVELCDTHTVRTNTVITRDFNVSKLPSGSKVKINTDNAPAARVRQFQLLSWPKDHDLPPSVSHLLDLMELVQSWQQQEGLRPPQSHILVHCLNGATRSGLYCAMAHTISKMESEQVVDPFSSVMTVSRCRPQVIHNLEQYRFLYKMVSAHSVNYNEYANVQH